jgi:C1A family cysteine protease
MEKMPKLGGWLKDAPDPRDQVFEMHESKFPLKESVDSGVVDLRKWCSPVEFQADVGSCGANATVGDLEFLQIRNGLPYVDLSRLFLYYNARVVLNDAERDSGTFIRLLMSTLTTLGTCSEELWPYDTNKVFVRPSWDSYRAAYDNKIDSYYRIAGTGKDRVEAVKRAIIAQHPVVFGMLVDQAYVDVGSDGMIAMPKSTRVNAGGHAQLIVGFDEGKRRFIVRNSWGIRWADDGYAYVPYDYLDASEADDFWVAYIPNAT